MKSELGFKVMHRREMEVTGTYTLREESEPYSANSTRESEVLRPETPYSGIKTLRSLRHSVVRPGAQFGALGRLRNHAEAQGSEIAVKSERWNII